MHPREAAAAREIPMETAAAAIVVWEARLVHAEPGRRVVEVSAWQRGQCLGRGLGEAEEAETAEERAITRLSRRLEGAMEAATAPAPPPATRQPLVRHAPEAASTPPPAAVQDSDPPSPVEPASPTETESPAASPMAPSAAGTGGSSPQLPQLPLELASDPDDWSEELAELDVQLQRLGWDRNHESTYLQRAFGHPSRNRLTAFADLAAYLRALRALHSGSTPDSAPVPLRRRDLLSQSEELLASLRWDANRGRSFLEQHFQLASRQQLSDEQLLQFNMLLEEELIDSGSAPATAASPA